MLLAVVEVPTATPTSLPVLGGLSSLAIVERFTGPSTGVVLRLGVLLRGLDLGLLAIPSW